MCKTQLRMGFIGLMTSCIHAARPWLCGRRYFVAVLGLMFI